MTNQKKKRGPPPEGSLSTPQRTSPTFVTPMAAQVLKRLPEGDDRVYELKFDGYRALIIKDIAGDPHPLAGASRALRTSNRSSIVDRSPSS